MTHISGETMTTFFDRTVVAYDVIQDQTERYPDWRIGCCKVMPTGGEVVIPDLKMFRFTAQLWELDQEWCRAHALAHLDLADGGNPSQIDCKMADTLARIRLDREGSRQ